jgi:ligand-binding sensor domain-containing protein
MKPVMVNLRAQIARVAFLAVIFFDSASTLRAQNYSIRFTRLTVEDGLSQNTVQCILQDREGFMWFGTQHGLNKYSFGY